SGDRGTPEPRGSPQQRGRGGRRDQSCAPFLRCPEARRGGEAPAGVQLERYPAHCARGRETWRVPARRGRGQDPAAGPGAALAVRGDDAITCAAADTSSAVFTIERLWKRPKRA